MACLTKFGGHKRTTGQAGMATMYQCISRIRLGLQGISHLASLSSSRLGCDSRKFHSELVHWGYMAGIGIRIRFIWVMYSWGCGLVASRPQWRFGIYSQSGFRWQSI